VIEEKIKGIKDSINGQLGIFIEEENESQTLEDAEELHQQYLGQANESLQSEQFVAKNAREPYYCHPENNQEDDPYVEEEGSFEDN